MAFWIYGVKTVYPEFQVQDVFTGKALGIFKTSVEDGCSAAGGAFAALPSDEMHSPGWSENRYVKEFLERNRPEHNPPTDCCCSSEAATMSS